MSPISIALFGKQFGSIFQYDKNKDSCMTESEWQSMPEKIQKLISQNFC
jgi:hypothetical protein